ncbi:hypothetical protein BD311DRAFT_344861 [Dichomitus squalens]|uniref:Uncharacterized protein n=1 Tax=Dichomitus squalens TaxID=114155 RepID=A0A4Q9N136_9APHY|nr:hypothetical protein BD311DRAFT_344861 [Dichomitus squalens]
MLPSVRCYGLQSLQSCRLFSTSSWEKDNPLFLSSSAVFATAGPSEVQGKASKYGHALLIIQVLHQCPLDYSLSIFQRLTLPGC